MTAPARPDRAVSDPIGLIVELVAAVEPTLAGEQVRGVVTGVAGGRAKARRLASALAERPGVLLDGRSPAPRAVGELLLALRGAGATTISSAVLRGVRQAAGQPAAPRPGLVLHGLRSAHRRRAPAAADTRPVSSRDRVGAATLRQVPGPRRPRPDHGDPRR